MAFVFVKFKSVNSRVGKPYREPQKWNRIIHDNIPWPELDETVHHWRARISHCWPSKEHPDSLNLKVDLGSDLEKASSELGSLRAVFLGAEEINLFYAPPGTENGHEVLTYQKAKESSREKLRFLIRDINAA